VSSALMADSRELRRRRAASVRTIGLDLGITAGMAIALIALAAGVAVTGIGARYFFQPVSVLIVLGGTVGVLLIATPWPALILALRRTCNLFSARDCPDREELIEEMVWYARIVWLQGIPAIKPAIDRVSHGFLQEALTLAIDAKERSELRSTLENKIRLSERQNEAAAKVLDVAGGLTPTLGVLGTVVGLIDVLRQFSSLPTVASGVGAAFTSTFYGLALANILLLPAAHRIRARAMDTFDLQEMLTEGALCLFDRLHPTLVRERLGAFLDSGRDRNGRFFPVDAARPTEHP
jgi:chemotaxis protein MotA